MKRRWQKRKKTASTIGSDTKRTIMIDRAVSNYEKFVFSVTIALIPLVVGYSIWVRNDELIQIASNSFDDAPLPKTVYCASIRVVGTDGWIRFTLFTTYMITFWTFWSGILQIAAFETNPYESETQRCLRSFVIALLAIYIDFFISAFKRECLYDNVLLGTFWSFVGLFVTHIIVTMCGHLLPIDILQKKASFFCGNIIILLSFISCCVIWIQQPAWVTFFLEGYWLLFYKIWYILFFYAYNIQDAPHMHDMFEMEGDNIVAI